MRVGDSPHLAPAAPRDPKQPTAVSPTPTPGFSPVSSFGVGSAAPRPPATSLLTENPSDASVNCLDRAADWVAMATPALRARSELVFLSDSRPGEEGRAGHVVVRQGARVLDPVTGESWPDLDAYLKTKPHYRAAGTVPASAAAKIFDAPAGSTARARAIADARLAPELGRLLVADSPPPPPTYGQADADRDATQLHDAIAGGLTGWGTDEDTVWATLSARAPTELQLISESYALHYGRSLRDELLSEVTGTDRDRVSALLAGDTAEAAAAVISGELDDTFVDEALILDTLERASPAERRGIAAALTAGDGPSTGRTPEERLLARLEGSFDERELARARALLAAGLAPDGGAADEAEAKAGKLAAAMDGAGTDEAALREVLEPATPAERAQIAAAYERQFGVPLRQRLEEELGGAERDELLGDLDSSGPAVTDAARLRAAMSGAGTDEARLREVLGGKTPAELDAIAAAYEVAYGEPLRDRIASELGGAERDVVLRMLEPEAGADDAAVAAAERLAAAVEGAGTDEAAIRAELAGLSKAELDRVAAAYERRYGEPLRDRLVSELGGRDELELVEQDFDLGAVDPSAPGAVAETARRLRERLDLERGIGLSLTNFVQNLTKGETDQARLEHQLSSAETSPDRAFADRRLRFAEGDLGSLQAAKRSAAEGAAQSAAIAASAVATAVTAGAGAPLLLVTAGGAFSGAAAGAGLYGLIEGRAGDLADTAKQGLIGAVTGATAALPTSGAGVLKALGLGARSGAVAGAADGATRAALDEQGTSVADLAQSVLTGAAAGAVFGGVLGGAARGLAATSRALRARGPELAPGLTLDETRAVYPWGGRLPSGVRELFEVPGFADFARASPESAKVLGDATWFWTGATAAVREAAQEAPEAAGAAWRELAERYAPMNPSITPHPTEPSYLVVERGPWSNAWVPELALHPRAALDHNGAFARRDWEDGQWLKTAAPDPTRFDPAQLIVGGKPLESLDGVMVFSGHGASIGFAGLSTARAAKLVADQIRAAAAKGRSIAAVVLDACHQRDTRWFRGGSNSQAFRDFVNAELEKAGLGPVTVLAAERGGPTWGTMQRSWLPTGLANGRLTYTFDRARYVDAGLDTRFYAGPAVLAVGATAVGGAGTVAVLRYLYGEEGG